MDREELLIQLTNNGVLVSPNIIAAFQRVDRADFVLPEYRDFAYDDQPLPIGYGQSISQPFTVAFMLEMLNPKKDEVVLDLGTGAGWTTALLAEAVGPKGRVYSVEIIGELLSFAKENLRDYEKDNVTLRLATDRLGLPEFSPFQKILVSAEAQEVPATLIDQLAISGTLVMPVQGSVVKIDKVTDTQLEMRAFPGFAFVPLRY